VSDQSLATYLRVEKELRKLRLAITLEEAISTKDLSIDKAALCYADDPVCQVLTHSNGKLMLVVPRTNRYELAGVITPFDLL
jgi:hypothetical protein